MNTQGWVRGLMSKNMPTAEYVEHVVDCIASEFEEDLGLSNSWVDKIGENYNINLFWKGFSHRTVIKAEVARELQNKSPYSLDKHIIDILVSKGLNLDKERSQYVRYCYSIFTDEELGK